MLRSTKTGVLSPEMVEKTLLTNQKNNKTTTSERLNKKAWFVIYIASIITFLGFIILDPNPNLLLAISAAANVGILLLVLYRLFLWNLLLHPVATIALGDGMLLYYSWGNLGARIAGDTRHGAMPGALNFYPEAAALTTLGLLIFYIVVFSFFQKQVRSYTMRYQDLLWKPGQVLFINFVSVAALGYLSSKYKFESGYFMDTSGFIDRTLAPSIYMFITLSVISSVSLSVRSRYRSDRRIGLLCLGFIVTLALLLRSRTFTMVVLLTAMICWLSLRPKDSTKILLSFTCIGLLFFLLGTLLKQLTMRYEAKSLQDNINSLLAIDSTAITNTRQAIATDIDYRMAGFELPAALILGYDQGVKPMYGGAIYGGFMQGLPSFLRPAGFYSERASIFENFVGRGLIHDESLGVPLASGLADFGVGASPLIYVVIGLYCVGLWRVAQLSPRFFVAFLISSAGPGDLFWQNAFTSVRFIAFAWIFLWLCAPLVMPAYSPNLDMSR